MTLNRDAQQEETLEKQIKQYFPEEKDTEYLLSNQDISSLEQLIDHGITTLKRMLKFKLHLLFLLLQVQHQRISDKNKLGNLIVVQNLLFF